LFTWLEVAKIEIETKIVTKAITNKDLNLMCLLKFEWDITSSS